MPRRDAVISERIDAGEICVFPIKGGYAAEYKIGRTKIPVPVRGDDAAAVMTDAKRWLKAPIWGAR